MGLSSRWLLSIFSISLASSCVPSNPVEPPTPQPFLVKGTDFSQLPKVLDAGFTFYNEDSVAQDPLEILKEGGLNTIRVKLWNTSTGDASLEYCKAYNEDLKALNLDLMLTVHYSDTWADPGQQAIPSNWENKSLSEVLDSVEEFTSKAVRELQPKYIQIGNEINHGFMHPLGQRTGDGNFQKLLERGVIAAKEADSTTMTMVHFAGIDGGMAFFNTIDSIPYDAIALSFYSKWHTKDIDAFEAYCWELHQKYQRPVYIVETSYPFTLDWADWTNNHVGGLSDLIDEYPPTPAGQEAFLNRMRAMTDSLGTGLIYWGGELVAYKGPQAQDGSPYENQALFNFNGVALPAINALGR